MSSRPDKKDTRGNRLNRMTSRSRDYQSDLPDSRQISVRRRGQRSSILFLLSLLVLPQVSCYRAPEHRLSVGTNINPGYECLYLARSLGYQKNLNIRLVELPSASEVLRAFRNKLIDAAALTMDEALLLAAQGHNPKVVLIMNRSHEGHVILAKPAIHFFRELKGRRIGVESTATGAYVLSRAIELGGLQPEDIIIVPLEEGEEENSFLKSEVDAVVVSDPARTRLMKDGARPLFDTALIPNEIVYVLVVREDAMITYHRELEGLIQSWFSAVNYLHEHPTASAEKMAPRTGMNPADLLISLNRLSIPELKENQQLLALKDPLFTESIKSLSESMNKHGLLTAPVDAPSLLSDKLVREGEE